MTIRVGRRQFISALGGVAAAWPLTARAQQTSRAPQIGFLYPGVTATAVIRIATLRDGLRAGGYDDADRLEILVRAAEGDPAKLAPMAADLVERKVDVIVAGAGGKIRHGRHCHRRQ
jgi:putative ABC transport system substrate-binding protein